MDSKGFTGTFPANSVSTIVIPPGGSDPDPTPTPTPDASCKVTCKVVNQWQGGFQGSVKITNQAGSPVQGWKLGWGRSPTARSSPSHGTAPTSRVARTPP
ncbi:cellulose binding domain-containing protein [Nonomuraea sp. NPDC005501]|uniref:cellulose binding domain-containing protein n=1 Tax=Nonomuraea sp. NPDC005501 TaxID=3156884 RepID=UPI0033AAA647